MFWDLHFHSTDSDGNKTPEERIEQIKILDPKNLGFWALTDHNRFSSDFVSLAREVDIQAIYAVEMPVYCKELCRPFDVTILASQLSLSIAQILTRIIE